MSHKMENNSKLMKHPLVGHVCNGGGFTEICPEGLYVSTLTIWAGEYHHERMNNSVEREPRYSVGAIQLSYSDGTKSHMIGVHRDEGGDEYAHRIIVFDEDDAIMSYEIWINHEWNRCGGVHIETTKGARFDSWDDAAKLGYDFVTAAPHKRLAGIYGLVDEEIEALGFIFRTKDVERKKKKNVDSGPAIDDAGAAKPSRLATADEDRDESPLKKRKAV